MSERGFRKWIITITVILASVIELIDTTIVNVALPQIRGNLGGTLDEIAWVVTAYAVANVIVVPMASWLSATLGRRNYFVGSIILFTASSFMCGQSHGIYELVLWRFIQGIGGGALMATSQAILVETFPPEQRALSNALFGMGVVVGPTIGPTLGGWITDNWSWQWCFYINLPIGALAAFLSLMFISDGEHSTKGQKIDYAGIAILALGVGAIQIVLERGEREDWFASAWILTLSIVAVVMLVAFLWRELTIDYPVVDLRVLRYRPLAVGTLLSFVLGCGLYASSFALPVMAQSLLGMSALQTGLLFLPGGIVTAMLMPIIGASMQKGASPQLMTGFGFLVSAYCMYVLSQSTLSSGLPNFLFPLILRGIGLSFLFVPITTFALSSLKGKDIAAGAGLTGMMRQLGGSFGVALSATFITKRVDFHRDILLGHMGATDPATLQRLHLLTGGFQVKGFAPAVAQHQALTVMNQQLTAQSYLLSYMDSFRVVGVFFLAMLPLLFLVKTEKGSARNAMMAH